MKLSSIFAIIQLNRSIVHDIEHFISEGNSFMIYRYIYTYTYIYIYIYIHIYIYIFIVEIKLLVGKVQQTLQNNWIKTKLPINKIKRIRYERCDKGNKTDNGYEKTNWNLKAWIHL